MRQVIVELDDKEMATLEAVARARRVAPAEVLKVEAIRGLRQVVTDIMADNVAIEGLVHMISTNDVTPDEAKEQRRQARLAVLMRSNGIFAGDKDKPKDGLVYQKELRAEWQ
jgi:membrane-associated protease RseP (regulator of RpoE activity)